MRSILFRLALACLVNMTLVSAAAAAPQVWVALAEEGGAYAETAAALREELVGAAETRAAVWRNLFAGAPPAPDLIVTVGAAALDGTLDELARRNTAWKEVPVLATLLPQAVFDARLAAGPVVRRPLSAVVLDQPLGRMLALIRRALPDHRHVGILPGPQTRPLMRALEREAAGQGLRLVVAPEIGLPEEIYPALKAVLGDADVILALPEPLVYHGGTLQNILLTTYRARTPLVAFSSAYVKAGAVLALYSTPAQVARRAAEMVRDWQAGGGLPAPQAPREFSVAVNAKVAASLGLSIDDAAAIVADLRRREGR